MPGTGELCYRGRHVFMGSVTSDTSPQFYTLTAKCLWKKEEHVYQYSSSNNCKLHHTHS